MEYAVDPFWLPVVIAIIAVVVVAAVAFALWRRSQRRAMAQNLRAEFGPEYERAVEEFGSRGRAERELVARKRRVRRLNIRPLHPTEFERYSASWNDIQRLFVDNPQLAVERAHDLVKQLMVARGYPVVDFDQRVKDLSVDHPLVVQHYRAARELFTHNQGREWNTEELRQSMVHYRALFGDLLERPSSGEAPYGYGREVPA